MDRHKIGTTTEPVALQELARGLQALAAKLSGAQAAQAFEPLLAQIGTTTEPVALQALAQALQALAPKLTEAQAAQAVEPLLAQIGTTTDPNGLQALALQALSQSLQVLAPKLSEAQAREASNKVNALLAWASTQDKAAWCARAFIALLDRAADPDRKQKLVKAVGYPTAAGQATDILIEAIHGRRGANLYWLAQRYPDVLRPPGCPQPPQSDPDLKCPSAGE
jgi:hypothetical protein